MPKKKPTFIGYTYSDDPDSEGDDETPLESIEYYLNEVAPEDWAKKITIYAWANVGTPDVNAPTAHWRDGSVLDAAVRELAALLRETFTDYKEVGWFIWDTPYDGGNDREACQKLRPTAQAMLLRAARALGIKQVVRAPEYDVTIDLATCIRKEFPEYLEEEECLAHILELEKDPA